MKKIIILNVAFVFLAAPSFARDATDGRSSDLAVQKIMCERLVNHTSSNDVDFQPGVDVNGNDVVPADLNSASQIMPEVIEVPLVFDLAKRLNVSLQGQEMRGIIGNLKLHRNGKVEFNGQDLTPQAMALCGNKIVPNVETDTMQPMTDGGFGNAQEVKSLPQADIPLPASAAPSSTMPAR